jgi:hypothetical protein
LISECYHPAIDDGFVQKTLLECKRLGMRKAKIKIGLIGKVFFISAQQKKGSGKYVEWNIRILNLKKSRMTFPTETVGLLFVNIFFKK